MKILPVLLLTSSLALLSKAEEKHLLEYTYKAGKTYVFTQDMEMNMEMNNPALGGEIKMKTTMDMDYTLVAQKHPKGTSVEMSFDKYAMTSQAGDMIMMSFDSTDPEASDSPVAAMLKPVIDMEIEMVFDEEGNILEIKGADTVDHLKQAGVDSNQFQQMISQGYTMMPKNPVGVGDSWSAEQEMPMGGMTEETPKMKMNFTLESFEELDGNKLAKIFYTANLSVDLSTEGAPMKMEFKKFEGHLWHDLALKMTRKSTLVADLVMGLPTGAEAGENGLGEIPCLMTTESNLIEVK